MPTFSVGNQVADSRDAPFHGDVIEAVQNEQGVWVPLKRPCENLGIDMEGQRKKLKIKKWAVTDFISVTATDGGVYSMFCVHLKSLPMWLGAEMEEEAETA